MIPLNFKADPEMQSIEELWVSVAELAAGRVVDNGRSTVYPIEVRKMQVETLQALVDAIKQTHEVMDKELTSTSYAPIMGA